MSNFRPKGWWIPYIKSGVDHSSLSKVCLNSLKDFPYWNGIRERRVFKDICSTKVYTNWTSRASIIRVILNRSIYRDLGAGCVFSL